MAKKGRKERVRTEQIEEWVMEGDYHSALQALGRPVFVPGERSLEEWVFVQMHQHHFQLRKEVGLPPHPRKYRDVRRFLKKVAANKLSVQDHDNCWRCYVHLAKLHRQTVFPLLYHTTFFDASPVDLAMGLVQRGDDEGLEIMLHFFPNLLPKWHLLDMFPVSVPAYHYARFIMEDETNKDQQWIDNHVQRRHNMGGIIIDWIQIYQQQQPSSPFIEKWLTLIQQSPTENQKESSKYTPVPRRMSIPGDCEKSIQVPIIKYGKRDKKGVPVDSVTSFSGTDDCSELTFVEVLPSQVERTTTVADAPPDSNCHDKKQNGDLCVQDPQLPGKDIGHANIEHHQGKASTVLDNTNQCGESQPQKNQILVNGHRHRHMLKDKKEGGIEGDRMRNLNEPEHQPEDTKESICPAESQSKDSGSQHEKEMSIVQSKDSPVANKETQNVTNVLERKKTLDSADSSNGKADVIGINNDNSNCQPLIGEGSQTQNVGNGTATECEVDSNSSPKDITSILESNNVENRAKATKHHTKDKVTLSRDHLSCKHAARGHEKEQEDSPCCNREPAREMAAVVDLEDNAQGELTNGSNDELAELQRSLAAVFEYQRRNNGKLDTPTYLNLKRHLSRVFSIHIEDHTDIHKLEAETASLQERIVELELMLKQQQQQQHQSANRDPAERKSHEAGQETTEGQSVTTEANALLMLKGKLQDLEAESAIQKRADKARIRYLEQMLRDHELAISSPNHAQDGGSPYRTPVKLISSPRHSKQQLSPHIPADVCNDEQVKELIYALECSEMQRAQALDDLRQERAFYVEKLRHLQLAFRKMAQNQSNGM